MKKLILIGFSACYKSTVGKKLAKKLQLDFVDTDSLVEQRFGKKVWQIFEQDGQQAFRNAEDQLLRLLVKKSNLIVACGGGSVTLESFCDLCKNATVVWLTATAQTIYSRLGEVKRPLADNLTLQQLQSFVDSRNPLYAKYATMQLATDNLSASQVANKLALALQAENNG